MLKMEMKLENFGVFHVEELVHVYSKSRQSLYDSRDEPTVASEQNFRAFFNRTLNSPIHAKHERFDGSKQFTDEDLLKHCKDLQLSLVSNSQSDINVVELWDDLTLHKAIRGVCRNIFAHLNL